MRPRSSHVVWMCGSEFLGTMLLVLVGPGTVAYTSAIKMTRPESLFVFAAAFGIIVAIAGIFLGPVSGAHINPAISLANCLARRLGRNLLLAYIFFQILGGLAGGAVLSILFPVSSSSSFLGSTSMAADVQPVAGLALEVVGTFILAVAALYVSLTKLKRVYQAALVGVVLFLLILAIGPLTGASLNPARSIGPALASGYYDNIGIYIVGPLIGALIAGIVVNRGRSVS